MVVDSSAVMDIRERSDQIHCKNGTEKYFPEVGRQVGQKRSPLTEVENFPGKVGHVLGSFAEHLTENFCF